MKRYTYTLLLSCSLGLQGLSAANQPKTITVGEYDTVYGIANKLGIRTQALIQANNLKGPSYTLQKGQVLRIPAPNEHVVRGGENLQSVAENYGVKPDVLAHANDIQSPYFVKEGDSLLIPPPDTESMADALKPLAQDITMSSLEPLPLVKSEPAPTKSEHVSVPSAAPAALPDDLAKELAQEREVHKGDKSKNIVNNSINNKPASEKPNVEGTLGQGKIVKLKNSAPVSHSSEENTEDAPPKPKKKEVKADKPVEKKVVKKEETKEEKTDQKSQESTFNWPVQGKVISKFKSGKNDGINIEVPEGTAVKAARAGEVKYAGSELKDHGQLVLIDHKDGWMTVYAHNSKLLVKKGDQVKLGQVIAESGKTGDVKTPQVHFEVRKGKQAVDPLPKLGS